MRALFIQPGEHFGGAERQGVLAVRDLPAAGVDVVPVVGPGRRVCEALDEAGVHDYVFSRDLGIDAEGSLPAWTWLPVAAHAVASWRAAGSQLVALARDRKVDLVVASRATGWSLAAVVGRRLNLPVVWRAGHAPSCSVQRWALKAAAALWRPRAVVADCDCVARSIESLAGCEASVIPNAVDVERFDPRRARGRYRAPASPDAGPVVGVAACPAPGPRLDLLADVIDRLRHAIPSLHVLMAGESGWRPAVESELMFRGLGRRVTFLGHVEDMPEFYTSCDVVLAVAPHRTPAGSPNALLEAQAMERPVVASRVGGVAETVRDGVDGTLVDADDVRALAAAAAALLTSAVVRRRMGAAGRRKIVEKFAPAAVVGRLAAVLHQASA